MTLSQLLPAQVVGALAAGAHPPHVSTGPAVVVFVDLVGFSQLVEEYAARGPTGSEDLSRLLRPFFARVTDDVAAAGGDVVAYIGDAVLATFPMRDEADLARAAACARRLARSDAADRALGRKVSLTAGDMRLTLLGDDAGPCLHVLGGEALEGLRALDGAANPGEVVVDAALAARHPASLAGASRGGVVVLDPGPDPSPGAPPSPLTVDEATLRPWLPTGLQRHLASGTWTGGFRTLTAVILPFAGRGGGSPTPEERQEGFLALRAALAPFETSPLQLVEDDKGVTFVAVFGLPGESHEDDTARAVRFAEAAVQGLRGLGLPAWAGVATSRGFVDLLGGERRAHLGCVAPALVLATRLAGLRAESPLCDATTANGAARRLSFTPLESVRVKGRDGLVPVFRSARGGGRLIEAHGLVGRSEARGLLASGADALGERELRVMVIGGAGLGKSSMLTELAARARERGLTVVVAEGDPLFRGRPYHLWSRLVAGLLGASVDHPTRGRARLDELLPADTPWRSLVQDLLPLGLPPDAATDQLRGQGRADALHEVVIRLVGAVAARGPVLLVADDLHWSDVASAQLLQAVAEAVPLAGVAIGTRPFATEARDDLEGVVGKGFTAVPLSGLGREELGSLLSMRLDSERLAPDVVDFFYAQTGGHPYYAEELARALRAAGRLRVEGGRVVLAPVPAGTPTAAPPTLENLFTERLDLLGPDEQLLVKIAAVVGGGSAASLGALHPRAWSEEAAAVALGHIVDRGILVESAGQFRFPHAIVQAAIAGLLSKGQRTEIHRRAAEQLEARATRGAAEVDALVTHWRGAEEPARLLPHLQSAAASAMDRGALVEGAHLIEELLATDDALRGRLGPLERARWTRNLGDCLLKLSRTAEAGPKLREAAAHLDGAPPEGRLGMVLGLLAGFLRQSLYRTFPSLAGGPAEDRERQLLLANIHQLLAQVWWFSNDALGLFYATVLAMNHAARAGRSKELAEAYGAGSVCAVLLGMQGAGDRLRLDAEEIAEAEKDPYTLGFAYLQSGICAVSVGSWSVAEESARRGAAHFTGINERFRAGTCHAMLALVVHHAGNRKDEARDEIQRARALVPEEVGLQVHAWAACHLLALRLLDDEPFAGELRDVERLCGRSPMLAEAIYLHGLAALARERMGDPDAAEAHLTRVEECARLSPPIIHYQLFGCWAASEAAMLRLARATPGEQPAALTRATNMVKVMNAMARSTPIARPRAAYVAARLAQTRKDVPGARRHLAKGLTAARRLAMPVELAALERLEQELSR